MLEWLIIGGGIHGTYLANLLTHLPGLERHQVRILDPHPGLLTAWERNAANCGMAYLRSPATHHIARPILSLYRYAQTRGALVRPMFTPPYNRPSLKLFQNHCRHVIAANRLEELHVHGRARAVKKDGCGLVVESDGPSLRARRLLLAVGMSEQPCWPAWAHALKIEGARIAHVFDADFTRAEWTQDRRTIVVGGGISAVQTALKLASETGGRVHLLSRHAPRESQYDFNPCWIGPKCLRAFYRTEPPQRRATIDQARIAGSLPGEVLASLNRALSANRIGFSEGQCQGARLTSGGVRLQTSAGVLEADQVILATGFRPRRPGGAMIDRLVREFDLKCNPCGYPLLGDDLRWAENIYATGPLAELQVGPCARNIVGARNAGRILLHGLGHERRPPPGR